MMKLVSSAVDKSGNQTKTLSECQSETRRSLDTQEGEVELAPFEISNILQIQCRKRNDFFLNYLMEATLDICSFPFNAVYVCQSSATSLQQKTIISTANTIIGFTEGRLGAPSMVSSKDAMEEKKTNRTIGAIKGFIEALKNARRKPRIPKTVSISV